MPRNVGTGYQDWAEVAGRSCCHRRSSHRPIVVRVHPIEGFIESSVVRVEGGALEASGVVSQVDNGVMVENSKAGSTVICAIDS